MLNKKSFSYNLKVLRAKKDMTQEDLSHATGIDRSTIAQLETGKSTRKYEDLIKLCATLDTNPNELFGI